MITNISLDQAFISLKLLRKNKPIIHNVTNLVVMQTSANILLALGASPIMAHAIAELAEISALTNALVINIGTIDDHWLSAISIAQQHALVNNLPIIFDPVGAGASHYRTQAAKEILLMGVSVLRGNSTEILALADAEIMSHGVDAANDCEQAIVAAKELSKKYNCVVAVSGKTDVIVFHEQTEVVTYGTEIFTKVTGMGCALTAVIAAFAAVNKNYFEATIEAITVYTLAGELAAQEAQGPGSFYTKFIDTLFAIEKAHV